MAKLLIYGLTDSTYVRTVRLLLEEIGRARVAPQTPLKSTRQLPPLVKP
jgi:hypothetical protein